MASHPRQMRHANPWREQSVPAAQALQQHRVEAMLTARRSCSSMFSASDALLRAICSFLNVSIAFFTLSTLRCRDTQVLDSGHR